MFNLHVGTGLGFTASKQIALGLGTGFVKAIVTAIKMFITKSAIHLFKTKRRLSR